MLVSAKINDNFLLERKEKEKLKKKNWGKTD